MAFYRIPKQLHAREPEKEKKRNLSLHVIITVGFRTVCTKMWPNQVGVARETQVVHVAQAGPYARLDTQGHSRWPFYSSPTHTLAPQFILDGHLTVSSTSQADEIMSNFIAVAVLADSSLALAAEWSTLLKEYLQPIMVRMSEQHPKFQVRDLIYTPNSSHQLGCLLTFSMACCSDLRRHQFRIAWATYGPGDSYSSPILTTRFFSLPDSMRTEFTKEMKGLCLGETGTGGSTGMAALEGYAALLEVRLNGSQHTALRFRHVANEVDEWAQMFDLFNNEKEFRPLRSRNINQTAETEPPPRQIASYIIHFAAGAPDGATHPMWNNSPVLDSLTWATLPVELKKVITAMSIRCAIIEVILS